VIPEFEARLRASALAAAPPALAAAATHLIDAGGKRMRPGLVMLFGELCGGDPRRLEELALAVEMLHAATLIHDDLIDEAETRRGHATLHVAFGRDVAVLIGDLYVARCGVHCANTGWVGSAGELYGALSTMVGGELEQRRHRFDLGQTEADYMEMIWRKTSTLLEAACAAACWIGVGAEAGADLPGQARQYGEHLGKAFQLVDDVLDYSASAADLGKPVGNDVREGTVTLPLILAVERDPGIAGAVASVRTGGAPDAVVAAVRATDALERCLALAEEEARRAVACLPHFADRPERRQLEQLAIDLPHRRL
jgi:geranylgeranyl pyrophosphate synthase